MEWSPGAEALFGHSRKVAIGQQVTTLIIPEQYRDSLWSGLEKYLETGRSGILDQQLELSALRSDGSEFPIELTITPLQLGGKRLFVGLISQPRRTRPLRSRRAQLALETRLLHQVANLSTSAESFEEALEKCVEVMCSVTGWPVGHVLVPDNAGEFLEATDIWHFADEQKYAGLRDADEYQRFRRGEGVPGKIWKIGEAVWSLVENAAPAGSATDDGGNGEAADTSDAASDLRGVFGFPVSVGGETVAVLEFFTREEVAPDPQLLILVGTIGTQLGRIIERLQWEDDRARLAAIVDGSYDAIIGKSLDGTIISWNTGAAQTYGWSAEEAIGESVEIILPEGARHEETEILRAIRTGRRLMQFETSRVRKDGTKLVVAITVSPIRDARGRIVGSSTVERDVTQRKQRERELEKAKAAAEEAREIAESANRTKTEFLANISHELRTPMNAIMGMLELSLGEDLNPVMEDYLRTAHDSAHTLLYLLDDLLDFSRMEAGRFELEAEPFDLRQTVDGIAKTLSLRACERGLELATRVASDVPHRLEGDGRRLRQILMNLTGNAIKFTDQGEVLVSVAVEERTADSVCLRFTVRDTGIGISPKDQQLIFCPFTQVDASTTRQRTGSGLGLAICRELVEKMDGRIWLESNPDAGTTFYFTARFGLLSDQPTPLRQIWNLRNLPVLIVDDNRTNLTILRETLAGWEMVPTVSTDARTGLAQLRRARQQGRPFALVIVDALMPDVDGFTLVETMHNEGLTETSAVLMLSSADRQAFKERCAELPIDMFLEKPVSQSELLDAVVQARFGPQPELPPTPTLTPTDRPLRILLVEDTPANQKVVQAMLEKRGHHVVIAGNGREALEQLKLSDFDTILMDVQMPTMDGLQATAAIRQMDDPRKSQLPIIAMTAHARRQDRVRCRAAGMDAYVSKPIDVQRLFQAVEGTNHQMSSSPSQWASDPAMDIPPTDIDAGPPPARRSNPPATRLINYEAALRRLGGRKELFGSLASFFLSDAPELIEQIREGLRSGDAEEVCRCAHSLKGLTANFDAQAAQECAYRMERLAAANQLPRAGQQLAELERHVDQLQDELRPFAHSTSG